MGPAHPLRGGLASFNERLAREFIREGNEVSLCSFSFQYPSFLFPGTTQYSSEPAPADLSIRSLIHSVNPLNWLSTGWKLMREKHDLIIVRYWLPFMGPCLGTILRIVRLNKKTRIICIADNIIPHEKRPGDSLFTRYFIASVHGFITMSEKVMSDLKKFTHKPALQLRHPLYDNFGEAMDPAEARKALGLIPNSPVILFFGFIRKYKGLDLFIEAIHHLKKTGWLQQHPVQFLVAGEFYENPEPYLNSIREREVTNEIILHHHFIPDSEIRLYLSAATVVIQPYHHATQSGVTPLAYHFEKPMIVTRVGSLPDLVPDSVGIVTEAEATSLAEGIIRFFSRNEDEMKQHIKEEKKKFGWDIFCRAILSLNTDPTYDIPK